MYLNIDMKVMKIFLEYLASGDIALLLISLPEDVWVVELVHELYLFEHVGPVRAVLVHLEHHHPSGRLVCHLQGERKRIAVRREKLRMASSAKGGREGQAIRYVVVTLPYQNRTDTTRAQRRSDGTPAGPRASRSNGNQTSFLQGSPSL